MTGIDSILPVNMSGTILLNTSDLSTWMPVFAAFLTVLATYVIVKLTNDLSFKKMQRLMEQNKEIECLKIEANERAVWEDAVNRNVAEFVAAVEEFCLITRDYVNLDRRGKDKDSIFCYLQGLQERDRMATVNMAKGKALVFNLLQDGISEHEDVMDKMHEVLERVYSQRCESHEHVGQIQNGASSLFDTFYKRAKKQIVKNKMVKESAVQMDNKQLAAEKFLSNLFIGVPNEFYLSVEKVIHKGRCRSCFSEDATTPPVDTNP